MEAKTEAKSLMSSDTELESGPNPRSPAIRVIVRLFEITVITSF